MKYFISFFIFVIFSFHIFAQKKPVVLAFVDHSAWKTAHQFQTGYLGKMSKGIVMIPVKSLEDIQGQLSSFADIHEYEIKGIMTFSHGNPDSIFFEGNKYNAQKVYEILLKPTINNFNVSKNFFFYMYGCAVSLELNKKDLSLQSKLSTMVHREMDYLPITKLNIYSHPGGVTNLGVLMGGIIRHIDFLGLITKSIGHPFHYFEKLIYKVSGGIGTVSSGINSYGGFLSIPLVLWMRHSSVIAEPFDLIFTSLGLTYFVGSLLRPQDQIVTKSIVTRDMIKTTKSYLRKMLNTCNQIFKS